MGKTCINMLFSVASTYQKYLQKVLETSRLPQISTSLVNHHLVGGIPTPLKNMSSSVGLKINSQHMESHNPVTRNPDSKRTRKCCIFSSESHLTDVFDMKSTCGASPQRNHGLISGPAGKIWKFHMETSKKHDCLILVEAQTCCKLGMNMDER